MGDQVANNTLLLVAKRAAIGLILVLAFGLFLAPQSVFADDTVPPVSDTESENPEQPVMPVGPALPATCSALTTAIQPEVGEDENAQAPVQPTENESSELGWSELALTGPARSNSLTLGWQWTTPTNANALATFKGYGYALYIDGALVTSGELDAQTTQYTYPAGANGTYRLFVWILDDTVNPDEPVATGCEYSDTVFDTTGPVIVGDSWTVLGNTATPLLSTDETDVTYAWAVDAELTAVTMSDAAALNPTFTFLADGTYTFTLTATDSLGNVTVVTLVISYFAPFIPGPEVPIIPEVPAPVDPYVPPEVIREKVERTTAVGSSYVAAIGGEVAAENNGIASPNVAGVTDTKNSNEPVVAQAVQRSNQGWLILGIPWYWWLVGIVVIGIVWQWYRSRGFSKTPDDV